MLGRLLLCLVLGVSALTAQSGLTFQQLQDILRSSKDQGLSDREVARVGRRTAHAAGFEVIAGIERGNVGSIAP